MSRTRFHHCFKNIPAPVIATVKGNTKQEIQHLQSTRKQSPPKKPKTAQEDKEFKDLTLDYFPTSYTPNFKMSEGMCIIIMNDERSVGYMYLTGIFPHRSDSGHEYLLFGYNYDANAILVEPLKTASKYYYRRMVEDQSTIRNSRSSTSHICTR